ncbi:MAG TPA: hypothetical protein VFE25_16155 [Opitutaceae bacterium]|jgi:hypothetical protein|nr:hypothetical protein [Opitutaceae bacterium]
MNEGRAPSPDFDSNRYERPNKKWVCGNAKDGCPCRIGPSPSGECRATTECTPRLVLKPGETKGTWACTRPADWGGPCAQGPGPDGNCCRAIEKCKPERSLRARRGLVTVAAVAASVAVLLIGLSGSRRDGFVNPRPLSRQHSGAEFARLAAGHGGGQGCVLCHTDANGSMGHLAMAALSTSKHSLSFAVLSSSHPKDFSHMDHSCVACHSAESFHQADVVKDTACVVCHMEHQGTESMAQVASHGCADCHGSAGDMALARERSAALPAALFTRQKAQGRLVHVEPRPAQGYTEVITSFAEDHPEFRVLREKTPDSNTLRFNHRFHLLGADVPLVNGRRLECADCHRPDASGAYMAKVSFEQSCRTCHGLEFDPETPGMKLPHGDPAFARNYLRSLPVQYADYATRVAGVNGTSAVDAYVRKRIESLRRREHSGEELERRVFLGEGSARREAGSAARASSTSCALCHEVTWKQSGAPAITAPAAPDRWLPGARFSHASHSTMSCGDCHAASSSELTSDVILPTQQSCVRCHSPKGGAVDTCTSCHTYHNPPPLFSRNAETASAR